MLNQTYTAVRHAKRKSLLGLSDRRTNKPYVVGFTKYDMAKRLTMWLPQEPLMRLERSIATDNLTGDFNEALSDVGLERFTIDQLTVDYAARLFIPKLLEADPDSDHSVFNVPAAEFLLYPFERSVGLILPTECIKETKKVAVFQVMIIDPCFNANLFIKSLSP